MNSVKSLPEDKRSRGDNLSSDPTVIKKPRLTNPVSTQNISDSEDSNSYSSSSSDSGKNHRYSNNSPVFSSTRPAIRPGGLSIRPTTNFVVSLDESDTDSPSSGSAPDSDSNQSSSEDSDRSDPGDAPISGEEGEESEYDEEDNEWLDESTPLPAASLSDTQTPQGAVTHEEISSDTSDVDSTAGSFESGSDLFSPQHLQPSQSVSEDDEEEEEEEEEQEDADDVSNDDDVASNEIDDEEDDEEDDDDVEEEEYEKEDSEEDDASGSIQDLVYKYVDYISRFSVRSVIRLHRAVLQGSKEAIVHLLENNQVPVDSPLIPRQAYPLETLESEHPIIPEIPITSPYQVPEQLTTGNDGPPNEVFLTGLIQDPETDLETLFHSPLLRASYLGLEEMAVFLISKGADRDYSSPLGWNPLSSLLHGTAPPGVIAKLIPILASQKNIYHPNPELNLITIAQKNPALHGQSPDVLQVFTLLLQAGVTAPNIQ